MNRVVIAVVYAVDVLEDDPQVNTYERFARDLPECVDAKILFASNALSATAGEMNDPDFDVDVRAHGRTLEPLPYADGRLAGRPNV
jgi:hypothetical protein